MHALVIGAGVVGVTTAWYLRQQGHDVTVLEQDSAPALGTSFANAGQLSFGYAMPWAAPGVPLKALKWLLDETAPLKIQLDPYNLSGQVAWLLRMWRNCTAEAFERNKRVMLAQSEYSRQATAELVRELPQLDFCHQQKGTLQVFRSPEQREAARRDIDLLGAAGVPCTPMNRDELLALEPGLARSAVGIAGGLHLPGDGTGDCHQFTQQLARMAQAQGVKILYNCLMSGWITGSDGRVLGVRCAAGDLRADAVVMCTGVSSTGWLRQLDIHVPIYPVKGYSLTVPLRDDEDRGRAPVSTVMDETYKVAITRLGDRIRVGGTAEICGFDARLKPQRRAVLEKSLGEMFPGAGAVKEASFWCGFRPSTPHGFPYVGPVQARPGLWLNAGHGTLGWTMACGTAKAVALSVAGKDKDVAPLVLQPVERPR